MKTNFYAAFFMEGLHSAGYDDCIKAVSDSMGCVEMVGDMTSYAVTMGLLVDAVEHVTADHPGVIAYEVAAPFGRWYGEQILEHKDLPEKSDVEAWLADNIKCFFCQNATTIPWDLTYKIDDAINTALNQPLQKKDEREWMPIPDETPFTGESVDFEYGF